MSTATAKTVSVARMQVSSLSGEIRTKPFRTFCTKVVDGASIVAEAVDITADKTAPKKSTRSHPGM